MPLLSQDTVCESALRKESVRKEKGREKFFYEFPRAALTKYHKHCGRNNRNLLSHSSGSWQSEIMV